MNSIWTGWWYNPTMWSALFGWILAQTTKIICLFARSKRINIRDLVSTGGIPSAHSAMASALVTSVALRNGTSHPLFAVTLAFAFVVMFDAQSVRRAAGIQAGILNQIIDELFKSHRFSEQKLVELLGHTPLEVFVGLVMGIFIAMIVHTIAMV